MTCFGHGLTDFGHGQLWAFLRVRRGRGGVGAREWGGPRGERGPKGWGPKHSKSVGPKGGGPKGGDPNPEKGWGQEGWEAQKFALFFPSPAPIFIFSLSLGMFSCLFVSLRVSSRVFFPLSGGLLLEFWSCFGRSGPQMCLFSPLGCPVKPWRHRVWPRPIWPRFGWGIALVGGPGEGGFGLVKKWGPEGWRPRRVEPRRVWGPEGWERAVRRRAFRASGGGRSHGVLSGGSGGSGGGRCGGGRSGGGRSGGGRSGGGRSGGGRSGGGRSGGGRSGGGRSGGGRSCGGRSCGGRSDRGRSDRGSDGGRSDGRRSEAGGEVGSVGQNRSGHQKSGRPWPKSPKATRWPKLAQVGSA